MRIKIGDMGTRVAPVSDRARVGPASFVMDDGGVAENARRQSVNALVQDREQTAQDERQQVREGQQRDLQMDLARQRERFQEEQQAKRNQGASAFASYQVELDELVTGTGQRLTSGQIKRDDAQAELDKALVELKKKHLEPLDREVRSTLEDNLILFDGKAKNHFGKIIQQHAKQEGVAAVTTGMEALQRLAVKDPGGATRQASMLLDANVGLFGADEVAKQKAKFSENAYATHYIERLTGARSNFGRLNALEAEIAKNEILDPAKKNALLNDIKTKTLQIQAQAEASERRHYAQAERAIGLINQLDARGMPIDAATWIKTQKAVAGTDYAPLVAGLMQANMETQQVLAKPIPEQMAYVRNLQAQALASSDLKVKAHADKLAKTVQNNVNLLTQQPLTYAVQRQGADGTPLDISNLTSWGDIMANRLAVVDPLAKQHGVPKRLLFQEEAAQLAQTLKGASTRDAMMVFATLKKSIPDDKAYRDTVMQVAPDSPVLAIAGLKAGRGTATDMKTTELILRGNGILNPNRKEDGRPGDSLIPMPSDKDMETLFAGQVNNAYAGKDLTRNAVYQSAKTIYAAMASDAGGDTAVLNNTRWKEAIQRAAGDIQTYQGRSVVLPHGVDYSRFRDDVRLRIDEIAASGRLADGLSANQLRSLPLENAGDDRYVIRAGDGVLKDKTGNTVVIDFGRPVVAPPATARKGASRAVGFEDTGGGAATGVTIK